MRVLVLVGALVAGAGTAAADWQNTRWGMSVDELRAADPNLQEPDDAEQRTQSGTMGAPRLKGTHSMGGKDFGSYFYFRDGGLARVSLEAIDRTGGNSILPNLKAMYGQPEREANDRFQSCDRWSVSWRDEKTRNAIRFNAGVCEEERHRSFNRAQVHYEPLPAAK